MNKVNSMHTLKTQYIDLQNKQKTYNKQGIKLLRSTGSFAVYDNSVYFYNNSGFTLLVLIFSRGHAKNEI